MEIEEKKAKRNGIYWIIPILLFIIFIMMVYDTSAFQDYAFKVKSWVTSNPFTSKSLEGNEKLESKTKNDINSIEDKLEKLMPPKPYIVVNTTTNRFSLRSSNGDTIRTGACSTGKDEILIVPNKKPIIFKTPKGIMTILNKRTSPVWTKPDWAFIEEGLPIPSARSSERIDNSTMGDYALGLGNG